MAMCQGEKKPAWGDGNESLAIDQGLSPETRAVPLDLKDGQTEGLSHGPWLGSSTKLLAVSPVLGKTRVVV